MSILASFKKWFTITDFVSHTKLRKSWMIIKWSLPNYTLLPTQILFPRVNMTFIHPSDENKQMIEISHQLHSVQFSHSVVSNSLWPHGLQHARLPCSSPTPGACSNSCPFSRRCHPTISSSVVPFSSCLQSFLASGSFPMSQSFASGGQSIGASASASVLPMNIQDWFPLGLTGLISLQSKRLSRVFSNTTVQKRQFFSTNYIIITLKYFVSPYNGVYFRIFRG